MSCEKIKAGVVESLFGGKRENIFLSLFDHLLVLCKVVSVSVASHYHKRRDVTSLSQDEAQPTI